MPFFKMIENVSRHFSKSKKIRVALLIDEFNSLVGLELHMADMGS